MPDLDFYNRRVKVHKYNGVYSFTLPLEFCEKLRLEKDDNINILIHQVVRHNGRVIDLCKIKGESLL